MIDHIPVISLIAGIDSSGNIVPMVVDSEGRVISSGQVQTLTDGTTITWDLSAGNIAVVTLAGNRTLNYSNISAGFHGFLIVIQDGTGSRTLAYTASKFRAPGSTAPILSTIADSIDILEVIAYDTNRLNIVANYGFGDIT